MRVGFLIAVLFLPLLAAMAQQTAPETVAVPQGSSMPGLGGLPVTINGPGYIEFGGGHSSLTQGNPSWTDAYVRTVISSGSNSYNGEITRQDRYGDNGWYLDAGVTHVFNPDWYGQVVMGTSTRSFFLPKFRADASISRKLLPQKQLVASLGGGYDRSKTVNWAYRVSPQFAYYFSFPLILQGGVTWTHGEPGSVLARSQYAAVTYGHEKEQYLVGRGEFGREAYDIIGPATTIMNFPYTDYSVAWRRWIGPGWGLNVMIEHYNSPYWTRNGGTLGFFLDF